MPYNGYKEYLEKYQAIMGKFENIKSSMKKDVPALLVNRIIYH